MPTAAMATPYRPAIVKARPGRAADQQRRDDGALHADARPAMMFVAGPVLDDSAMRRTGLPAV
jgi:hypothetical protein